MLTFSYTARDTASNKIIHSTVQAESERAAIKLLVDRGLMPSKVEPEVDKKNFISSLRGRITTKDKVVFSRQLATLINAGLPLTQCLRTTQEQTSNVKLKAIVQDIVTSVEGGKTLSSSFARHEIFGEFYIALIAAGETSGKLDDALERIANQQEKDAEIQSKVKGAMVYPLIVLAVILLVIIFMLTTVVPQIEVLYKGLGRALPFLTQIMVTAGHIVTNFWWLIILTLGFIGFFLKKYVKTDDGRKQWDTLKLNFPMFGDLFRKLYMARFCRTGEILLRSGVQMLEMLRITSDAVSNVPVRDCIVRASEKVKSGKALSTSLKSEQYILSLVPQMVKIGEQSGSIDSMMGKAATFYENEVDNAIRTISTMIEPMLMVVLAVVAGGLVGAILLPVYGLVATGGV